jgi:hypothetical protein
VPNRPGAHDLFTHLRERENLRTSLKRRSEKFEEIFRETPHPGDALRPQLGHHVYRAEALGQP